MKKMKKTTNFGPVNDGDVINKVYLDQKFKKTDGHIYYFENDYIELKLEYNKQPVKEILIQRAMETTFQILYDKGLFHGFPSSDKVLEDFLFVTRRRGGLSEEVNDDNQ